MASSSSMAENVKSSSAAETRRAAPSRTVFIAAGAALVLTVAGVGYWVNASRFEETDDAQIDGTIGNVSPRVAGHIRTVYVVENQSVKEGDKLAELDPSDLQIAVDRAKAQVALAEAELRAQDPSVSITVSSNESALSGARSDLNGAQAALSAMRKEADQLASQVAQAEANDRTAQLERSRSEKLLAQGAVAQADFDARSNAAAASAANVQALQHSFAAARDRVTQQQAQLVALQSHLVEVRSNAPLEVATRQATVVSREASLDLAHAELAQAEKNLSYAVLTAPASGIIAKKSVAVGDYVAPGQQLFALTQTESLYVTGNFRETQLERMRPGQTVSIHVDALGSTLHGVVDSVGGATGSRLSVLPPENASGNYVKVVQRIPVRIRIDPGQSGLDRLRIGMSVEPQVTLQ